ncbi:MAG: cobyrinate a,c-diamide synthase [Alphaproteobacteria bacterium]|nr:cobyrinate a,c-diamide synthase [Alphaproteobacteria bacterium]
MAPGLIVAAPASGSGKTTLTLALLRHFRNAGVGVASFKVGPDYIDPAFHRAASGRECLNLCPWGMTPATLQALAAAVGLDAELVIGEGVMGLFDGATDGTGATADLAALTGWPVLLVVDVGAQAASAAAVVRGFLAHRADVRITGLVFNRVGGPSHAATLRAATAAVTDVPILGCLPRDAALTLPERHLGLVQAAETPGLDAFLDRAAATIARHVDVAALRALAQPPRLTPEGVPPVPVPPLGARIAVARDAAFAFAYPATLRGWRRAGAELSFFAPLADETPEACADAVYLPGGYPELHAGRLAGARQFQAGVRGAAARGATVYGECGGYMVLGESLIDGGAHAHPMLGLLPLATSFAAPRLHLGYRQVRLMAAGPLGAAGAAFRGHEFHYASITREGEETRLFQGRDAQGADLGALGLRRGRVMGSFIHLIDGRAA